MDEEKRVGGPEGSQGGFLTSRAGFPGEIARLPGSSRDFFGFENVEKSEEGGGSNSERGGMRLGSRGKS